MNCRIISTRDGFAGLEADWNRLVASFPAHPFQEFAWAQAWLRTLGTTESRQPHVVTLWEGASLLAVMPLVLWRYKGVRMLEWIGARTADYLDVLLHPLVESKPALKLMWETLERRGGFDVLRLSQVRSDAYVTALLDELHPWVETLEHAYAFPLRRSNGAGWLESQSSKGRARIRGGLRRMRKLGLEFHVWNQGEPLAPLLDAVIEQERAWLQERCADAFLTEPQGESFLRNLAEALGKSGSLHLSVLRSPQGIVATHFGFYRNEVLYYYMPTYDRTWSKHSVGTMLRDLLALWACEHGARRFDMLRGAYDYKGAYHVDAEAMRTLVVSRGVIGRAAVTLYRLRQEPALPHYRLSRVRSRPSDVRGHG